MWVILVRSKVDLREIGYGRSEEEKLEYKLNGCRKKKKCRYVLTLVRDNLLLNFLLMEMRCQ